VTVYLYDPTMKHLGFRAFKCAAARATEVLPSKLSFAILRLISMAQRRRLLAEVSTYPSWAPI